MTNALTRADLPDYAGMVEVMLAGMSTNSRRQYEHTYSDWLVWCAANGVDANVLSAPNVMHYLNSRPLSRARPWRRPVCDARRWHRV